MADVAIRVIASSDIVGLGHLRLQMAEKIAPDLVAATSPSPGETAVLATPDLDTHSYQTLRRVALDLRYTTGGMFKPDLIACLETHRTKAN